MYWFTYKLIFNLFNFSFTCLFGCVFACRIRIADRLLFFPFSDEDVLFAEHRRTNKQSELQVLFMGRERERERERERKPLFLHLFT